MTLRRPERCYLRESFVVVSSRKLD